jgi:hypothetical protein
MRVAGQASRSNKFAILWAADHRNRVCFDINGYLRRLVLRVTWSSFGNTAVSVCVRDVASPGVVKGHPTRNSGPSSFSGRPAASLPARSSCIRGRLQIQSTTCLDRSTERVTFGSPVRLGIKLAGVHWGYRTPSHAAEATAGYYNVHGRDGYAPYFRLMSRHRGVISFTCVEMRDCEHPPESACSPEDLLRQIIHNSKVYGKPNPLWGITPVSPPCDHRDVIFPLHFDSLC